MFTWLNSWYMVFSTKKCLQHKVNEKKKKKTHYKMALQEGFLSGGLGKWIYNSLFSLLSQKFDFSLQESSLNKVGNHLYFEKVPR